MAKESPAASDTRSSLRDLGGIWSRRDQIWKQVPRADKLSFGAGIVLMALVALAETGIALLLGGFFDRVV